jgi:hypothetical protein
MEEIEQLRKSLGSLVDGYTDHQVWQLDHELRAMAELLLDIYLDKKKTSKGFHSNAFDDVVS